MWSLRTATCVRTTAYALQMVLVNATFTEQQLTSPFSRQAFELVFNLTDFTTTNGVRFANAAQQGRVYSLVNLNCSDHGRGTAAPNGTVVPALLTTGWFADECERRAHCP